jgi:hypothetical protein
MSKSTSINDLPKQDSNSNDVEESMMVNSILQQIENDEEVLNDENEDSLQYTMDVSQIPPKINEQMPDKQMIEEATKDIFEQANQEVMDALNNNDNSSNDLLEDNDSNSINIESSKEVEEEKNKINLSPDVDDIMNKIIKNIKIPILVCVLFILLTLPQVNKLFVKFLPRLSNTTGQVNLLGNLIKGLILSLIVFGSSFFI